MEVCALDLREYQLCAKFSKCEILAGSSGILRPCGIYRWYSSGSKEDRCHHRVAKADNSHRSKKFSRFSKLFQEICEGFLQDYDAFDKANLEEYQVHLDWQMREHFQLLKDL